MTPNDMDIAVVIPTYNRATLIGDALDSVIKQTTTRRIEVAIVDDGSTDNTEQVLQPYLQRFGDPRGRVLIRYTRLEKLGVVTARNTAIAQTTAPFIAFLDSDDYWHERKLELQLRCMEDDAGVGVVHTSFRYVNEQGELTDDGPHRLDNPCAGQCTSALLDEMLVIFSSSMFRRSVIDAAATAESHGLPFDPRWTNAQDYDLLLRASRLSRFAYIPEPLTYYRFHSQHGAMGNLQRAFGFHCRVQLDFVRRWGGELGIDEAEAKRRAANFLRGRAESMFWQRKLDTCRQLCQLARELQISDESFVTLERKAAKPVWMYRIKDGVDRLLRRR